MAIGDMLPSLARHRSMRPQSLDELKAEMDRMFDGFLTPFARSDRTAMSFFPETEVHETDTEIRINMELPGVEEKDIDISVTGDVLSVRGEKKHESEIKDDDFYRSERSYGTFQRSMSLPAGIEENAVEAHFDKGVLHLVVHKPKQAQAKSAKIKIKGA